MELPPIAPSPFEVLFAVGFITATLVALVFAVYAINKMARHEWPVGFALPLVLFTFVVPFSGPVILGLRTLMLRRHGSSAPERA